MKSLACLAYGVNQVVVYFLFYIHDQDRAFFTIPGFVRIRGK